MDISLHYVEEGRGTPLVLLHGNGESSSYFKYQIAHFSRKYRVIAVDTRGHGKSPRGVLPFTLEQFADDLKWLLDELGIAGTHVLGFSDGANIAMIFALKYPGYVERLVLNGGNLYPAGMKTGALLSVSAGYLSSCLVSLFLRKAARTRELLGLMVLEPRIRPRQLRQITCPALVIAGSRDMIRESHTRLIHRWLKDSRLCIVEGNHFVARENWKEFNQSVDGFLEE